MTLFPTFWIQISNSDERSSESHDRSSRLDILQPCVVDDESLSGAICSPRAFFMLIWKLRPMVLISEDRPPRNRLLRNLLGVNGWIVRSWPSDPSVVLPSRLVGIEKWRWPRGFMELVDRDGGVACRNNRVCCWSATGHNLDGLGLQTAISTCVECAIRSATEVSSRSVHALNSMKIAGQLAWRTGNTSGRRPSDKRMPCHAASLRHTRNVAQMDAVEGGSSVEPLGPDSLGLPSWNAGAKPATGGGGGSTGVGDNGAGRR